MASKEKAYHGFDLGSAADAQTLKKYAINLRTSAYANLIGVLQMKVLDEKTKGEYTLIKLQDALARAILIPMRITYAKNGKEDDTQSSIIYIPRDRIEEAIDNDSGVKGKTYSGHKIIDIRVPRRRRFSVT